MNKVPRFIKEYANYKKQKIYNMKDMHFSEKDRVTVTIDKALRMYERGLFTVDETIKIIADC